MTLVDAQDIVRTYDCAFAGCDGEARTPGGYCDRGHNGQRELPTGNGALAHLMNDEPEEKPVASCKIDGCSNPPAGKGGSWAGMCSEHIRERAGRRHSNVKPKTVKPPPVAKKPNATTTTNAIEIVLDTNGSPTLVELAQAVQDATARKNAAVAALQAALEVV